MLLYVFAEYHVNVIAITICNFYNTQKWFLILSKIYLDLKKLVFFKLELCIQISNPNAN